MWWDLGPFPKTDFLGSTTVLQPEVMLQPPKSKQGCLQETTA